MNAESNNILDPDIIIKKAVSNQSNTENIAISSNSNPMQVAQKESRSGFLLLSVKHLSKIKNKKISNYDESKLDNSFDDFCDDSCIGKSSKHNLDYPVHRGNSFDFGRCQLSSTASLEAEEYDDEEDLEISLHSPKLAKNDNMSTSFGTTPQNANILKSIKLINSECLSNGQNNFVNSTEFTNLEVYPDINPQFHLELQTSPSLANNSTLSSKESKFLMKQSQIENNVSHLLVVDKTNEKTSLQHTISDQTFNECNLISDLQLPSVQQITDVVQSPTKHQSASFLNQKTIPDSTLLHKIIQNNHEQYYPEYLRSVSDTQTLPQKIFSNIDSSIQPASRFRKARIRETIEQWNSERLSFHDCRLKALPIWMSNLQAKLPSLLNTNSHFHKSRCLFCFVPGNFGIPCISKHRQSSRACVGKYLSLSSLRPSLHSQELNNTRAMNISGVLQATKASFQTCAFQGFNLNKLALFWNNGRQIAHKLPQEKSDWLRYTNPTKMQLKAKEFVDNQELESKKLNLFNNQKLIADLTKDNTGHNSTDLHQILNIKHDLYSNFSSNSEFVLNGTLNLSASHFTQLFPATEQPFNKDVIDPSAAYLRHIMENQSLLSDMEMGPISINEHGLSNILYDTSLLSPNTIPTKMIESNITSEYIAKNIVNGEQFVPPTSPSGFLNEWQPVHNSDLKSTTVNGCQNNILDNNRLLEQIYADPSQIDLRNLILNELDASHKLNLQLNTPIQPSPSSPDTELCSAFIPYQPPDKLLNRDELSEVRLRTRQGSTSSTDIMTAMQKSDGVCEITKNLHTSINCSAMERAASLDPLNKVPPPSTGAPEGIHVGPELFPQTPSHPPTTPFADRVEARLPHSMEVIRLAIVSTFQEELVHLNSQNAALRSELQKMKFENLALRSYQHAFQALQPFVLPKYWEQVQLEGHRLAQAAAAAHDQHMSTTSASDFVQQLQHHGLPSMQTTNPPQTNPFVNVGSFSQSPTSTQYQFADSNCQTNTSPSPTPGNVIMQSSDSSNITTSAAQPTIPPQSIFKVVKLTELPHNSMPDMRTNTKPSNFHP